MAGFDAGSSTDELTYDFSTSKVADAAAREVLKDAKGTIPEPSQKMVDDYRKAMFRMVGDPQIANVVQAAAHGQDVGSMTDAQVVAVLGKIDSDKLLKAMDGQQEHLIKLCAGSPSKKQIMALPPRERAAFFGWLAGELLEDPTKRIAASTPSPVGVNGAAPIT